MKLKNSLKNMKVVKNLEKVLQNAQDCQINGEYK